MKQVCLLCDRTSPDSNLFCQQVDCPVELSPHILEEGEFLGDIEIIRLLTVLRSAALYIAMHQDKQVFLKIAHPGERHKIRLKREAMFLKAVRHEDNPRLPKLLLPYVNTTLEDDTVGKSVLRERVLYYYLFEYVAVEPLRDVLMKNVQLWINHVGWLTLELASALAFLNSKGAYHFGLSPDCVLVRFEPKQPKVPRILLADLGIVSTIESLKKDWYPDFVLPAYTAPELVETQPTRPEYATDVYGLGIVLFELLVGQPAFPFKMRTNAEVFRAIQRNCRVKMSRLEDVRRVAEIAVQAVSPNIINRQSDVTVIRHQLIFCFGQVPNEKRRYRLSRATVMIMLTLVLAICILTGVAMYMNEIAL